MINVYTPKLSWNDSIILFWHTVYEVNTISVIIIQGLLVLLMYWAAILNFRRQSPAICTLSVQGACTTHRFAKISHFLVWRPIILLY